MATLNRGSLQEGWSDAAMLRKAIEAFYTERGIMLCSIDIVWDTNETVGGQRTATIRKMSFTGDQL